MAHLFTFLCEYKGGTYTSQLRASDTRTVFAHWADRFLEQNVLTEASEKAEFAAAVRYSLSEGGLTPLDGLTNVWYEGFSIGDDLLEVTVVSTSEGDIVAAP